MNEHLWVPPQISDSLRFIQFSIVDRYIYKLLNGEYDYTFYMTCYYEVHQSVYGVPCGPTLEMVPPPEVGYMPNLMSYIYKTNVHETNLKQLKNMVQSKPSSKTPVSDAVANIIAVNNMPPNEALMISTRPQDWELQARKILFTDMS